MHNTVIGVAALCLCAAAAMAATPEQLAAEQELVRSLEIKPDRLKPLMLDTTLVADGQARAVICHAEDPAWRAAAEVVRAAVRDATGCELPMVAADELSFEDADAQNLILLGMLDNNRHVARLYHNFYVCLDVGYTGREGYVIRSVHNPWGAGHNTILLGGSYAEGTARAAEAFAPIVANAAQGDSLTIGRQLVLEFDGADRQEPTHEPWTPEQLETAVKGGRDLMFSPGQGRSGVSRLVSFGETFQRTGDPLAGEAYKAMMQALWEYYNTDEYILSEGLARYDTDFRDAWTWEVAVLWDLHEESGLFNDEERLRYTNLVMKLMLEIEAYQGYVRHLEYWLTNNTIVHNHNTFPALGAYFVGEYFQRHYGLERAQLWLDVAHGVFRGQRHSPKPLEDAAAYQWLPIIHTMIYSLAGGDTTFFDEGHALEAARVAQMVTDNAGWQSAFGDHSEYKSASCIRPMLPPIVWYHRDPRVAWFMEKVGGPADGPIGQLYHTEVRPVPPTEHIGLTLARLPRMCYDYVPNSPQYPAPLNLPYEVSFDKLAFRAGLETTDAYMLLDGFGRGTHLHFDANAIIRYAEGGEPLLVDGEYIKNAPKYHNALVIIRDGQSELPPAITGLGAGADLPACAYSRTWLNDYNGTEWTRRIVWRGNDYVLVDDRVEAREPGEYTLRCCWRPWGDVMSLEGNTLTVRHPPMTLQIVNADGAPASLEYMKTSGGLPISRLARQVGLTLAAGAGYRFVNVIEAHPQEQQRPITVRRVAEGLTVVERPEGAEVIALGPEGLAAAGIAGEAELVVLGEGLLISTGVTELSPQGETEQRFATGETPARFTEIRERVLAMPAMSATAGGADLQAPPLTEAWRAGGFEPPLQPLRVASVTSDQETYGRYGPVEKLIDGGFNSSVFSAQWPAGVTPTITLELMSAAEISSVELREWHMSETWDIGERRLELSSDGFVNDVRVVDAPFVESGTQRWGNNVNTIMTVPVNQRARQLRLTISPAREDASVYLAEVTVYGTQPGAFPEITAVTTGALGEGGAPVVVVASAAGEIRAFDADGGLLWDYDTGDRARVNALACADFNGDGRIEIAWGGDGARLGLLTSDGTPLWQVTPPQYRGIPSDVMTIVPADIDGKGTPEIIAGARSWQYFAYDGAGEMLWRNIIYAHSATVGYADDFDGDGLPEIVGGNAYYTLNLIDQDGKRIYSRNRLGPEQTAVGSADVDGDGLPEILMGTDLGELICYDGDGSPLWQANVGDKTTRILSMDLDGDGVAEIVCAAESANVYAFDASGALIWRRALPDGVTDLALLPGQAPRFVAAAGAAGVIVLDARGEVLGRGAVAGRAQKVVVLDGRIAATTSEGIVTAFTVGK